MDTAAKEELAAVLDEDELELLYENKDGDKRERVYEFKIFTFLNKLIKWAISERKWRVAFVTYRKAEPPV